MDPASIIGIVVGVFVVIFGGRGLVDLVRGAKERRQLGLSTTEAPPRDVAETDAPAPVIAPPAPDPVYRRTFVGRDAELETLRRAFDEALDGHGSLAMVVGEPGIGKTSLTEQLAGYVLEKGGKTLVGHCYEEGSLSLPYLAFVEAVRSHVLAVSEEVLQSQLGQGADELSRIVPEIRERAGVDLPPPGDPEEERYRLLQAASDFLRSAATVQPLLIVLEDLHDADRGTLDMLTHLARNLSGARLLVIGTYRDVQVDRAHPLSSALAELHRVTTFERLALRGLTQDEVHRMFQAIAGSEVPWRWAEAVHQQTEGNPLFVQEVMRYLMEEGELADSEDGSLAGRIPEGLRDVIGKRMTRLSEPCNRALSVAAVIGREFSLSVLERVAALPEADLYGALQEASNAAVVEERNAVGGSVTFRFTHAFFRQTLYEEMFAAHRNRYHQQIAHALEEEYAARLSEHAAEMAEHFAQSTDPSDLTKALDYSEMAAQRSMDVYAYGEAAKLLEQALKVQEVVAPDDDEKRCGLLLSLGQALLPAGEPLRVANDVASEAFALAEALDSRSRASDASLLALDGLSRYAGAAAWRTPEWRQWVEQAQRFSDAGTPGRVKADLALSAMLGGGSLDDRNRSLDVARDALAVARQLAEPETLFDVVRLNIQYLNGPQHQQERLRLIEEFANAPREGVSIRTASRVLWQAGYFLLGWGRREEAEELWRQQAAMAERSGDAGVIMYPFMYDITKATFDGHLEQALDFRQRLIGRVEELGGTRIGISNADNASRGAVLYLGRYDEILAENMSEIGSAIGGGVSLVLAHAGRFDEARTAMTALFSSSGLSDGTTAIQQLEMILETAVLLGDKELARDFVDLLAPASHLITPGWQAPIWCIGRVVGGAFALIGKPDEARASYQQALEIGTKARHRPEIALTRLQLAELLLDSFPDERAQAIEHLDFAIVEFRDMNMAPSLERAETLRVRRS